MVTSGIILTIIRKVVSRILALIVCMGYGSVRPSLERHTWYSLGILGLLYFISSCIYEIAQVLYDEETITEFWFLISNIPVDIFDIIFYGWIISSLWYTIRDLRANKQTAKMTVYNKLFIMLLVYLCSSILVLLVQGFYNVTKAYSTQWPYYWIFHAANNLLFYLAFLTIIILWRPSMHNKRYLYSEQLTSDEFMNDSDENQLDIEMMLQENDSDSDDEITVAKRGKNRLRHVEFSVPTPANTQTNDDEING